MGKKFKLIILTLAVVGLLAGALAAIGSVSARGNAAASDTSPVMDFQDHGGVIVMNAKQRGTSDLVRTVDGIGMNIDTTDLPVGAYTVWSATVNLPGAGVAGGDVAVGDVAAGGAAAGAAGAGVASDDPPPHARATTATKTATSETLNREFLSNMACLPLVCGRLRTKTEKS